MAESDAPKGLKDSAQGFNRFQPWEPFTKPVRPHKALPSSALLEKHPVRRVGGAEGARDAAAR
jgi:hypothetical protein